MFPASRPHRVQVGIIGCGKIAINHIQALQRIDGVEVIAVADVDVRPCAAVRPDLRSAAGVRGR